MNNTHGKPAALDGTTAADLLRVEDLV